jgi:hypothetical protein
MADYINPADHDVIPDGRDIQQGIIDLCAEIQRRGGAEVQFATGKKYTWLKNQSRPGGAVGCIILTGLPWSKLNFNGSTISSPFNFQPSGKWTSGPVPASNVWAYMIYLQNCKNIKIGAPSFEQTYAPDDYDPYSGMHGLTLADGCEGIEIEGELRQVGGSIGVAIGRSAGNTDEKRSQSLYLAANVKKCFYGMFPQQNGDNSTYIIKSRDVGRTAGGYGISNCEFHIDSRSMRLYDDVLFTSMADPSENFDATVTSNIRCWYKWRPDVGISIPKGTLLNIGIRNTDPARPGNCIIKNIHVTVDFDCTFSNAQPGTAVQFIGAPPASGGHHHMDNIKVDGEIYGMPLTPYAVRCGTGGPDNINWNLIKRRGIDLSSLIVDSAGGGCAVEINGLGAEPGGIILPRSCTGALRLTNMPPALVA